MSNTELIMFILNVVAIAITLGSIEHSETRDDDWQVGENWINRDAFKYMLTRVGVN